MKSAYIMKELPEDERPREKLVLNGARSLSNPELLAILLWPIWEGAEWTNW